MRRGRRSPNAPARILIVEDHPIVRQGYVKLIGEEFKICGMTDGARESLRHLKLARPDLVIVDLTLVEGHGLDLIRQIATRHPRVKVLVISAKDELGFARRALEAGASGYVNKQEAAQRLIEAIRSVLRGDVYLSEIMKECLIRGRAGGQTTNEDEPSPAEVLTPRELEVLQLIGQGKSTAQIGRTLHLSPKTIERHKANIRGKLHLANSTELLHRATRWVL